MQVDHTKNIIEVKNVSFSYTNEEEVLKNVTLNIHRGDYLGVIGPNGGGKTTLLKIMLGLLTPLHGEVCLFGKNLREFKDWPRIGYVPQKAGSVDANFPLTVEEVVQMGRVGKKGLFHRLDSRDREIVMQSLRQVEMEKYTNRLIGDLSGGQQQRVYIARALASEPEVIFLDEPTVGVDVNAQGLFYELLKKLNKKLNITLVLVSHDIDMVAQEVTEIACVNKILIYDSRPKEFIQSGGLKKIYGDQVKFIVHHH
jgi:zinc transport system ATP-binding protein